MASHLLASQRGGEGPSDADRGQALHNGQCHEGDASDLRCAETAFAAGGGLLPTDPETVRIAIEQLRTIMN